ncbi:OprD family outer membrane porin [Corallincola platygyrae]|uniref:OprD family outer membrane porin n=1 Tax=Corallincola platygyrae TaxID=1193278 RepID=A0ABW4XST5_9GAMM
MIRQIVFTIAGLLLVVGKGLADERAPTQKDPLFDEPSLAEELADKSTLVGGWSFIHRNRTRRDESGNSNRFFDDLDHSTAQADVKFKSGWLWQQWGLNFSAFSALDLYIDDDLPRNIENEFSFAGDRWSEENSDAAENGVSVSRLVLKYRNQPKWFRVKAGYAPMHVPGIIGVNWSFQPGTYRGVQAKFIPKDWTITYAWADQYKAPWYLKTQNFSRVNAWDEAPVSGGNRIDYIHALGAIYHPKHHTWSVAFSAGQSEDYVDAYFFKVANRWDWLDGVTASYQFYGADSKDDPDYPLYDGLAWQQALTLSVTDQNWLYRLEFMATKAEGLGTYLPRLTRGYANSQGALELWWDSRSDWNNDGEKALFAGVWYQFPAEWGLQGWQIGASGAYGWDAVRWVNHQEDSDAAKGEESAWNIDLGYTVSEGPWRGASIKLHYTHYRNHQDDLGSFYYANMFTSERDLKLLLSVPFEVF